MFMNQTKGILLNLLASAADSKGQVDLQRLQQTYGPQLRQTIVELQRIAGSEPDLRRTSKNSLFRYLDDKALRALVAGERLMPSMPAFRSQLRRTAREHPDNPLGTMKVLVHGHIVGNTIGLLEKTGIRPEDPLICGKPFSMDPRVAARERARGFQVQSNSIDEDGPAVERYLTEQLRSIPDPAKIKRPVFLLVDDGGQLIKIAARLVKTRYPSHAHLFAAVEQTTRGLRRMEELQRNGELPFAVWSVAGSWAKTIYSSPAHGYAVAKETCKFVRDLERQGVRVSRKATVIGDGNVGHQAALGLVQAGFDVTVYDKKYDNLAANALRDARTRLAKEGIRIALGKKEALSHAGLVVSCAGAPTIDHQALGWMKDGAVVVNGASLGEIALRADRQTRRAEIGNASELRRGRVKVSHDGKMHGLFKQKVVYLGELEESNQAHQIWRTSQDKHYKHVILARGGGVINFPQYPNEDRNTGSAIPARYIQLDIGLMHLGMVQAALAQDVLFHAPRR